MKLSVTPSVGKYTDHPLLVHESPEGISPVYGGVLACDALFVHLVFHMYMLSIVGSFDT